MLDQSKTDGERPGCRQFDVEFPAYLEGEARPELVAHARECPFCGALLGDLAQIREASQELPLAEPPARLWANVRAALREEGIIRDQVSVWARWMPRFSFFPEIRPVGALAGLAFLAVALLTSPRRYERPGDSGILPAGEPVVMAGVVAPDLAPDLAASIAAMEEAYQAQESTIEPALKSTYQKSLETINASIEECIRQCRREPGNALARQFLIRAYESKAEVLASALEFNR